MYLSNDAANTAIQNLATTFPSICSLITLPFTTIPGKTSVRPQARRRRQRGREVFLMTVATTSRVGQLRSPYQPGHRFATGVFGKHRPNLRRKVVHGSADSDTDQHATPRGVPHCESRRSLREHDRRCVVEEEPESCE